MGPTAKISFFALLLVLLFSFPFVFAAAPPDLSDFAVGLPASIRVPSESLTQTPSRISVWALVNNPDDKDWVLYLLENQNGTWVNERALGVIQPHRTENFSFDFEAKYTGVRYQEHEYALVATGNAVPLGQYFKVAEDWTAYEDQAALQLHQMTLVLVPAGAGIVMVLLIVLAEWGYSSRSPGREGEEYTTRSLFLPALAGQGWGEELAKLMAHPAVWVLEGLAVAGLAVMMFDGQRAEGMGVLLLTGLGALAMPLVYSSLLWIYNQQVEKTPLRFFVGAFLWGAVAAVLALGANSWYGAGLQNLLGLNAAAMALLVTAVAAPLAEEALKGVGLVILSAHREFSDALHGLLLGFAVGLGFSFVENWFYLAAKTDPLQMGLVAWAGLAAYRLVFNSISHGCFSAALGASIGWAKSQNWGALVALSAVPGLMVAAVLHALFNLSAVLDGFSAGAADYPVYVFNPTLAVVLLALTAASLWQAVDDHRKREIRLKAQAGSNR